jgi:hypothetical protein
MFDLLFRSAWQALPTTLEGEQGFQAAAAMVLHTWNQKLEPHVHVHAVVPGGGPSLNGCRWITSRRRSGAKLPGAYLVDADHLRVAFRDAYLKGLKRLHQAGKLKLQGVWLRLRHQTAFEQFLKPLEQQDWVTYIQPPPTTTDGRTDCSPQHVVKYLARYITGGPISDRRLVSDENGQVTFRARSGDTTGGTREQIPVPLSGVEFVRRWSRHILPAGFVKTRHYGGYSNRHRQAYLEQCRELLNSASQHEPAAGDSLDAADDRETLESSSTSENDGQACAECGQVLQCIAGNPRPSWYDIMASRKRPKWYDDG